MLVWDFIKISPHDQPDWRDGVHSMHVEVQEPFKNSALEVMMKICDSKAKTQSPPGGQMRPLNMGERSSVVTDGRVGLPELWPGPKTGAG